jgi:creatinine amidohydrolase
VKLEDLTWKEVAEYLKSNRRLIVPIGTCEQHGPHLPLNTDTLVNEKLAEYLSEKTGILVGPT